MSMSDWLKKRLSPVKDSSDRWVELSEALQEYWEEGFDPDIKKLRNAISVFTADEDLLEMRIDELGDYFRYSTGDKEDWPLQILWRRLELEDKESNAIIQRVLRRKFSGLDIEWHPLYASVNVAYGEDLKTKNDIAAYGVNIDDYFLTSRGKVTVEVSAWSKFDMTLQEFIDAVDYEINRILPTHIVYDGASLTGSSLAMAVKVAGNVSIWPTTTVSMDPFVG